MVPPSTYGVFIPFARIITQQRERVEQWSKAILDGNNLTLEKVEQLADFADEMGVWGFAAALPRQTLEALTQFSHAKTSPGACVAMMANLALGRYYRALRSTIYVTGDVGLSMVRRQMAYVMGLRLRNILSHLTLRQRRGFTLTSLELGQVYYLHGRDVSLSYAVAQRKEANENVAAVQIAVAEFYDQRDQRLISEVTMGPAAHVKVVADEWPPRESRAAVIEEATPVAIAIATQRKSVATPAVMPVLASNVVASSMPIAVGNEMPTMPRRTIVMSTIPAVLPISTPSLLVPVGYTSIANQAMYSSPSVLPLTLLSPLSTYVVSYQLNSIILASFPMTALRLTTASNIFTLPLVSVPAARGPVIPGNLILPVVSVTAAPMLTAIPMPVASSLTSMPATVAASQPMASLPDVDGPVKIDVPALGLFESHVSQEYIEDPADGPPPVSPLIDLAAGSSISDEFHGQFKGAMNQYWDKSIGKSWHWNAGLRRTPWQGWFTIVAPIKPVVRFAPIVPLALHHTQRLKRDLSYSRITLKRALADTLRLKPPYVRLASHHLKAVRPRMPATLPLSIVSNII